MDLKERILENFRSICAIPRGSGDEKAISDFLVKFASERGFEVHQDENWNVIINVPGTCGMEDHPAVALQGHMDMVYVKTPDSPHVYENGIETKIEDGFMMSTLNTSLGADDGMSIAYCMTLMEDKTIPHPPLEMLITVLEEVGLIGAQKMDCSSLKAKSFINLDSEREGQIFTSCSGGIRDTVKVPMGEKEAIGGLKNYEVRIYGLKGGHSGMEIDLGRANGIKVMERILKYSDSEKVHLANFFHNGKANAIPHACTARVGVEASEAEAFVKALNDNYNVIFNEFQFSDTMNFEVKEISDELTYYSQDSKKKLYDIITLLPFGLIAKSFAIPGLTETSVNIGSCDEIEGNITTLLCSARSSVKSRKMELTEKIDLVAEIYGCTTEKAGDYPQWDYNPDSKLREIALASYKEVTGKDATCNAMHAGLECGYYCEKMPGVDMISIGCDIFDVHSVKEKVDVESFLRTWDVLLAILAKL